VIIRRVRAILLQLLCLALNLVWLADCFGQPYPIPNPTEAKSYPPPFWMWQNENPESSAAEIKWRKEAAEADELWLKQDTVQGIPKFENLLPQTELVFGKDSKTVALVLIRIGFLYRMRGDFDRAVPYIERSLKLLNALPDNAENLETKANQYWGLGLSYSLHFELDRAIQAFNESLKLKEKVVGADDSSLVEILINIAISHSAQGRPIDAIPLLERALAISEKKFGPESAEAATALALLGDTRAQAGQFEPALSSLKRSLQIREKILPPTSPDLGTATSSLGTIYLRLVITRKQCLFLNAPYCYSRKAMFRMIADPLVRLPTR
jgi:tetratricopeptide (TPR) repeat protein